jgi:hypothetical protein
MARNRRKPLILLKNETQPLSNLLIFLVNEIVGLARIARLPRSSLLSY